MNVNAGIYVLDMSVRNFFEKGKKITMPQIITRAKEKHEKVILFPLHEECIDLGLGPGIQRHAMRCQL